MAEKWPRFGGPQPTWQLGWAVSLMDGLRASTYKRMWSGRRAVVLVWLAAVGCVCSALIRRSSWTGNWAAGHEKWVPLRIAADREKGGASWRQVRLRAQSLPHRRFRRASMRAYVHVVRVCVYICMYVCVLTCTYVYICMCICICIRMHVYTCVYVCVCIFVHGLWVSVAVLQRVGTVS